MRAAPPVGLCRLHVCGVAACGFVGLCRPQATAFLLPHTSTQNLEVKPHMVEAHTWRKKLGANSAEPTPVGRIATDAPAGGDERDGAGQAAAGGQRDVGRAGGGGCGRARECSSSTAEPVALFATPFVAEESYLDEILGFSVAVSPAPPPT